MFSTPSPILAPTSQPEHNGGDGEHRPIIDRSFLVAGGDVPELLQAVDQPLDDIPLPVRCFERYGKSTVAFTLDLQ